MGFSVSGSFAILVVSTFVAVGLFVGATSNAVERVTEAEQAAIEDGLGEQNAAINVTTAAWSSTDGNLTIEVENTGARTLIVNETDVIVDNAYFGHDEFVVEEVDDNGDSLDGANEDTDLWLPGEIYRVKIEDSILDDELTVPLDPQRVKIVTDVGVTDAREVQ